MFLKILLAGFAMTGQAFATGGFSCSVDDENLQFEASSAMGRGMGGPILNLTATAKVKMKGTPTDLVDHDLKAKLVHSWADHPDFRLHFYTEREGEKPHGSLELIVTTTASEEDTHEGEYRLTVFFTEPPATVGEGSYLKATGKISCFLE